MTIRKRDPTEDVVKKYLRDRIKAIGTSVGPIRLYDNPVGMMGGHKGRPDYTMYLPDTFSNASAEVEVKRTSGILSPAQRTFIREHYKYGKVIVVYGRDGVDLLIEDLIDKYLSSFDVVYYGKASPKSLEDIPHDYVPWR